MNLTIRKSSRKQAKMKLAIQGPSGSGKTYGSLLLAYGLTKDWSKVAVIDTENGSADLYADLGDYCVIPIHHPYSPEMYIKAIDVCENHGIEVIIIDSLSHCWEYLLDEHAKMPGNSFANWSKVTPRLTRLVQHILKSKTHIIATLRTKQDYVISDKNGKMVPEKVGLKAIQKDGVDYEFTTVFEVDSSHQAKSAKDRTGLFAEKPPFKISSATGDIIRAWCNDRDETSFETIANRIGETKSLAELLEIYNDYPEFRRKLKDEFILQKARLTKTETSGAT